jgi:AraC family transcriptional regulator
VTRRPARPRPDLPERLGAAVDYLEARLGDEVDIDQAARRAGFSRWHFMRLFQAAAGLPVAEYVRRRRLARAAAALEAGRPVLEAALDWGYESQAAFTRAFARAFGVTPAAHAQRARQGGPPLEFQGPFEPRLPFEIGALPAPARVERAAFRAVGVGMSVTSRRYQTFRDIPAFWEDWFRNERWRRLSPAPGAATYGLARQHASGEVEYVIAIEAGPCGAVPRGYRAVQVPGGPYAVFSADGPPTATIQTLTLAAYGRWLGKTGARRRPGAWDIEGYQEATDLAAGWLRCALCIPLAG